MISSRHEKCNRLQNSSLHSTRNLCYLQKRPKNILRFLVYIVFPHFDSVFPFRLMVHTERRIGIHPLILLSSYSSHHKIFSGFLLFFKNI